MTSKAKSHHGLERAVAKYETKVAKAANPTQRQYASNMLRMARAALAEAQAGDATVAPAGDDVVDLRPDEYEAK